MLFEPILPTAEREKLAVRPPPTEEIARANVFRVYRSLGVADEEAAALLEWLLAQDSALRFCSCECAFAEDVAGCMRRLRLSRLRCRPRARARRRQRHGGSRCERSPPSDDGGGSSDPPSPTRTAALRSLEQSGRAAR